MWNKITFKSVVLGCDFIQFREMIINNIWISHTITTACVEVREILVWLNRRRSKSLGCVYLIYLVPRVMCPLLLSHVTLISHIITQQVSASHPWINYNNKKRNKIALPSVRIVHIYIVKSTKFIKRLESLIFMEWESLSITNCEFTISSKEILPLKQHQISNISNIYPYIKCQLYKRKTIQMSTSYSPEYNFSLAKKKWYVLTKN